MKLSELQNKQIINMNDGKNIGSIIDIKINEENGEILSFIIEPNKNFLSFKGNKYTEVSWKSINKIGEDVILVKVSI